MSYWIGPAVLVAVVIVALSLAWWFAFRPIKPHQVKQDTVPTSNYPGYGFKELAYQSGVPEELVQDWWMIVRDYPFFGDPYSEHRYSDEAWERTKASIKAKYKLVKATEKGGLA